MPQSNVLEIPSIFEIAKEMIAEVLVQPLSDSGIDAEISWDSDTEFTLSVDAFQKVVIPPLDLKPYLLRRGAKVSKKGFLYRVIPLGGSRSFRKAMELGDQRLTQRTGPYEQDVWDYVFSSRVFDEKHPIDRILAEMTEREKAIAKARGVLVYEWATGASKGWRYDEKSGRWFTFRTVTSAPKQTGAWWINKSQNKEGIVLKPGVATVLKFLGLV